MRRFAPTLVLAVGSVFAGPAAAGPYVGVMYGDFNYSDNLGHVDLEMSGPTLRLGFTLGEWVGLEVRGGYSDYGGGNGFEAQVRKYGTGLMRIGFPRDDKRLIPYVFGGLSYVDMDTEPSAMPFIDDAVGITYGVGVDLFADAHGGITLEWMRVDDEEDGVEYQLEHFGIGYTHRF